MGKVGSSSILKTFKSEFDGNIFHVHNLTLDHFDYLVYADIEKRNRVIQKIKDIQRSVLSNEKWKIISLVRDPIDRNISAFFQNINLFVPDLLNKYRNKEILLAELFCMFFEKASHKYPLNWFDNQIRKTFGIDIFLEDFSKHKGYHIYRKDNFELLILRLEDLNNCFEPAIRDFLNIENINLKNDNISKDKEYKKIYQKFKNNIIIPESYFELMYNSKFTKYFYTEAEIKKFVKRWSNF